MKKVRGNWSQPAVDGALRGRQKSALKMRRRWLVLLACALVVVLLGAVSPVMAITPEEQVAKCEEALAAGGCIIINVTSFLVWDYSNTNPPAASLLDTKSPVSGNDHTCAPQTFSVQRVTTVPGEKYYNVASFKYFYDPIGKKWVAYTDGNSAAGMFWATDHQASQWESAADYVMTSYSTFPVYYTPPWVMYPNGCSDLPSKQPDHPSNSDTGKPECSNQIPLN